MGCDDVDSKPEKPPDAALEGEVRLQNGTTPSTPPHSLLARFQSVTVAVCGTEEKVVLCDGRGVVAGNAVTVVRL